MKKIPTLFKRDPDDMRKVTREVHPDAAWVLDGEGIPTRKYDGTCVGYFPKFNGRVYCIPVVRGEDWHGGAGSGDVPESGDLTGVWLARREVKPGKTAPAGFLPVQTDPATGKAVGWEPVEQSSFAKLHTQALANGVLDTWPHEEPVLGATYELIGPKVNGNPERLDEHILVRHGYWAAVDREEMQALQLDFDGLLRWLLDHPDWEGIVWHHPDGRRAKLKWRDATATVGGETS